MIKAFLETQLDRALDNEISNAVHNCHARGLSSIVFSDKPRIRMFFAHEHHELHKNRLPLQDDMSVAFHPHHCDIRLVLLFGPAQNIFTEIDPRQDGRLLHECRYSSKLHNGKGGLEPTGQKFGFQAHMAPLTANLKAAQLHTVFVTKDYRAAWLVLEGREDPDYQPLCYTTNPHFDPTDFYVPMPKQDITSIISETLACL